eukprot:scaffold86_cov338-Pavlova_lutheri.AAC.63
MSRVLLRAHLGPSKAQVPMVEHAQQPHVVRFHSFVVSADQVPDRPLPTRTRKAVSYAKCVPRKTLDPSNPTGTGCTIHGWCHRNTCGGMEGAPKKQGNIGLDLGNTWATLDDTLHNVRSTNRS